MFTGKQYLTERRFSILWNSIGKKVRPYVWPAKYEIDAKKIRGSVIKTGFCIFGAKTLAIVTPLLWKDLINALTTLQAVAGGIDETAAMAATSLVALSFGCWAASDILEKSADQYKSVMFSAVKQRTTRQIGKSLMHKLFNLDHQYHTNRETGAILKVFLLKELLIYFFLI